MYLSTIDQPRQSTKGAVAANVLTAETGSIDDQPLRGQPRLLVTEANSPAIVT